MDPFTTWSIALKFFSTILNAYRLLVLNKFCIAIYLALPLVPPMCCLIVVLQSRSSTLSMIDSGAL